MCRFAVQKQGHRHHDRQAKIADRIESRAPAIFADQILQYRRPDRAGEVGTREDKRDSEAAAPSKPQGDIGDDRSKHGGGAERPTQERDCREKLP